MFFGEVTLTVTVVNGGVILKSKGQRSRSLRKKM